MNKGRKGAAPPVAECTPPLSAILGEASVLGEGQQEITLGGVVRNGGISDKTQTIATEGN